MYIKSIHFSENCPAPPHHIISYHIASITRVSGIWNSNLHFLILRKNSTSHTVSLRGAINNIPLLEIRDFGPPTRGGHFVLFHSFLPPQPFGTQFHTAHSSPVQLVSLTLPHVGGRERISLSVQGELLFTWGNLLYEATS